MSQIALTNVVNISVSESNLGVGSYNTSNLAIFTDEIPADSFGSLGYAAYVDPSSVATDFGASSKTFLMADAVFSQQPNILAGGGQLIAIPMTVASQTLTFSAAPVSGTFVLNYGGHASAAINYSDTAAQIQAKLQAVTGLSEVLVTGSIAGELVTVQFNGCYGVLSLMTVTSNTLNGSITVTVATSVAGETLAAAITRTKGLVQYFGIVSTTNVAEMGQVDMLAAAAVVLPLNKIAFFVSNSSADVNPAGALDLLRSGDFNNSRGLYYGDVSEVNDMVEMASYAGRALSTNFSGSNTTSTMHLKVLNGVQPDATMTQTLLDLCIAAGVDTYISLQGDAAVFCSGANQFFDQVYNLQWFIGALQVAGFNYLAQSNTKIPQTENGMDGLKGSYRAVCSQAVINQYLAPGKWNSSNTFGNPADLIANVSQVGYYIYSLPISQQAQVGRVARKAPLVQLAIKEAGAIQESTVIVNVNA